jgi:hypothetical protein
MIFTGRRKRVNVTRDKLEDVAFCNRTQIHFDHVHSTASTRVDGVEFWCNLDAREVW